MNYSIQHLIIEYGYQIQLLTFIFLFIISWNVENVGGAIFNHKKWKHAFVNAPFIVSSIPGQFILGLFFVKIIQFTTQYHFGFLYSLHYRNSVWIFLISFTFLDFGEYIYHRLMHRIKRLWMFHIVHHSDPVVDVSTTLREHPGENFIRLSFTLLWVFISGAAFWALMLRQIIQAFTTLFAHMNYRLPDKIDSIVGLIFITPNLHQVHHHCKQPYTDRNFGDVLSIWDRMFGTFKRMPSEKLVFGVDAFRKKEYVDGFLSLLKLPFVKLRRKNNRH